MVYLVHLLLDLVLLAAIVIMFRKLGALKTQSHQLRLDVDHLANRVLMVILNRQDAEPRKQSSPAIFSVLDGGGKRRDADVPQKLALSEPQETATAPALLPQ
jgi:hypothetical protein